jgi:hypothetical protein
MHSFGCDKEVACEEDKGNSGDFFGSGLPSSGWIGGNGEDGLVTPETDEAGSGALGGGNGCEEVDGEGSDGAATG